MSQWEYQEPTSSTSPQAVRRIARDVADIMRNPMNADGVFYIHDESNMLRGAALIIGAEGSPYAHGCYFFEVSFPYDYPSRPPKLRAMTQDRTQPTRFHPNLYRNGKVCRAGLNTWRGQGWTSCMTLRTVLLDVAQAMNKEFPITEEPDISEKHPDAKPYNIALTYKNLEIAVCGTLRDGQCMYGMFAPIYMDYYLANRDKVLHGVDEASSAGEAVDVYVGIYEMRTKGSYAEIKIELEALLPPTPDHAAVQESGHSNGASAQN
jgi:ubiquitin-conjugating enzyme E2 Z